MSPATVNGAGVGGGRGRHTGHGRPTDHSLEYVHLGIDRTRIARAWKEIGALNGRMESASPGHENRSAAEADTGEVKRTATRDHEDVGLIAFTVVCRSQWRRTRPGIRPALVRKKGKCGKERPVGDAVNDAHRTDIVGGEIHLRVGRDVIFAARLVDRAGEAHRRHGRSHVGHGRGVGDGVGVIGEVNEVEEVEERALVVRDFLVADVGPVIVRVQDFSIRPHDAGDGQAGPGRDH